MNQYDFAERLLFSKGVVAQTCEQTLMEHIPGCVAIRKATTEEDRNGTDYVATLRGGAEFWIDHKARGPGCAAFWKTGPELSLELWSVKPSPSCSGKAGWTLKESGRCDATLHTFAPVDSPAFYLLPFQFLRMAFRKRWREWAREFPVATQSSGNWESECVFVPASVVLEAVADEMRGFR